MKRISCGAIAVAISASVLACSGGDDSGPGCTQAPLAIATGTWCITLTDTVNTCSAGLGAPYTVTFAQSGSTITASRSGGSYTGSLCGSSGTMTGTDQGVVVSVAVAFSDASHASGTSSWSTTGCSGTDTFTAHSGVCL